MCSAGAYNDGYIVHVCLLFTCMLHQTVLYRHYMDTRPFIITYHSAYIIDPTPTDAGGVCKTSSQRTRVTRDCTTLVAI